MSYYLSPEQLEGFTSLSELSAQQYSDFKTQLTVQLFWRGKPLCLRKTVCKLHVSCSPVICFIRQRRVMNCI